MRVAADVAKKERDAQKLREKMREMGLHEYDESVTSTHFLTQWGACYTLAPLLQGIF